MNCPHLAKPLQGWERAQSMKLWYDSSWRCSPLRNRHPEPNGSRWATPTSLFQHRPGHPPTPGQLERYDCEYKRNGTANLFIFLDVHRPWRKVKVTNSRAAVDFAACMRELTDLHFRKAERIRVVLGNLSTHSAGALYQAFPACEARQVLRRLEFHYVPKQRAPEAFRCRSQAAISDTSRYSASWRAHQMDVHNRESPHQLGRAYPSTRHRFQAPNQRVIITVQRY